MKILSVCSLYINTMSLYIVSNQQLYTMNMFITSILDTIPIFIHPSPVWLNFRRGLFYSGMWIFNHLPADIKSSMNDWECFHLALKRFLKSNSFYTLDKLFNCNRLPRMLCVCLLGLGRFFCDLSPQFIIPMTMIRKVILGCWCMVVWSI
jgi:hypothetical protein